MNDHLQSGARSPLSENHARRVLATVKYVDELLVQLQHLGRGEISVFEGITVDLTPAQAGYVLDTLTAIRQRLLETLERCGVTLPASRQTVTWAMQVMLTMVDISLSEMRPESMRGYGALDTGYAVAIDAAIEDLSRLIARLKKFLATGLGEDLETRFARLERAPVDVALLTTLTRIVRDRGLVELRPALESVVERLERPAFEIAVFGRASAGKSSLLNALVGMPVLPVGVVPVTAVPVRLRRGTETRAWISFADAPTIEVPPATLVEFASEMQNPGNARRVTRIEVAVASKALPSGVVLVDTPGIGALGTSGTQEAYASVPHADAGVLLIPAGVPLSGDDLALLRALTTAAARPLLVVSKFDLLPPEDGSTFLDYARATVAREFGEQFPVAPVSVVGKHRYLLELWFAEAVQPLFRDSERLAERALRRKVAAIREAVATVLRSMLAQRAPASAPSAPREWRALAEAGAQQLVAARAAIRQAATVVAQAQAEGLDAAAARLAAAYAQEQTIDAEVEVDRAIRTLVDGASRDVREQLEEVRVTLLERASQLSEHVGLQPPAPDDLHVDLSGMPLLPAGPWLAAPVRRPHLARYLTRGLQGRVRRLLEAAADPRLSIELRRYAWAFERWAEGAYQRLARQYDEVIEPARGTLERGESEAGQSLDLDGLRAELAAIESFIA
ncbi:MAG: dynamin family protein [Ardenticatenaceae bacterium]|nr:dynamin family protein [Ardenticatenaceae bacterium]